MRCYSVVATCVLLTATGAAATSRPASRPIWTYVQTVKGWPIRGSAFLLGNSVIVATNASIRSLALSSGTLQWRNASAGYPADASKNTILATRSRIVVSYDRAGHVRRIDRPCIGSTVPIAVATDGTNDVAVCSGGATDESMSATIYSDRTGRRLVRTIAMPFSQAGRIDVVEHQDPSRVVFFAAGDGAGRVLWAGFAIDLRTGSTESLPDSAFWSMQQIATRKRARLSIPCPTGMLQGVLSTGSIAIVLCGGRGGPLEVDAYRGRALSQASPTPHS